MSYRGDVHIEPEVHIIEKYFQEVLHCFTITNILLKHRKEIDVLAINPIKLERYHIEVNAWTCEKVRQKDLAYFQEDKFEHPTVKQKIRELFGDVVYHKILVVWNIKDDHVIDVAKERFSIEIRYMQEILQELREAVSCGKIKGSRDDILRTVELVNKSYEIARKKV